MGLNRLYEFQISASKIERASRFVESAGAAIAVTTVSSAARYTAADALVAFPGLTLTQTVQHLGITLALGFAVLYGARFAFHMLVRRADLDARVLILGSRGPAHALANQIVQHPESGFVVVGLLPEPEPTRGRRRGDAPPNLVTASEEASSEATRALVLQDIRLLGQEVENQGAAMCGTKPVEAGQGEESLVELIEKLAIETVVVALEDRRMTLPIKDLLKAKLAAEVREREEIYEQVTGRIVVMAMRPSYLIFNEGSPPPGARSCSGGRRGGVGRHAHGAVAGDAATALTVRLTSPGPVLFTQERVGQDGRPFVLTSSAPCARTPRSPGRSGPARTTPASPLRPLHAQDAAR